MPNRKTYIDGNGDVTELDGDFFAEAVRGLPPVLGSAGAEQVSITLDSDVLLRLRTDGGDWRARINRILRHALDLQG